MRFLELGQELLEDALARSSGTAVAVEPVLVDDGPSRGLVGVVRQRNAEMIAVGNPTGYSGCARGKRQKSVTFR